MSALSSFRRRLMIGAYPKEQPNYLCFTALESGTFTLTIYSSISTAYYTYAAYSINDTRSWVRLDNVIGQNVSITTPSVNAGDKVYWKGLGTRTIGSENIDANNGLRFTSTCRRLPDTHRRVRAHPPEFHGNCGRRVLWFIPQEHESCRRSRT